MIDSNNNLNIEQESDNQVIINTDKLHDTDRNVVISEHRDLFGLNNRRLPKINQIHYKNNVSDDWSEKDNVNDIDYTGAYNSDDKNDGDENERNDYIIDKKLVKMVKKVIMKVMIEVKVIVKMKVKIRVKIIETKRLIIVVILIVKIILK